jgi:hypothetical protein
MLVGGAVGLGREAGSPPVAAGGSNLPAVSGAAHQPTAYPVQLTGELDPQLSRWLWLVKWLLLIPHFVVLFFLWVAMAVCTVIAGFGILFTGRYPRSLFDFNVGVVRWSWRVGFYGYSALGTDRYPPFTLARTAYPADFDVEYPERLSRGLVLVKWWLLAIPHYIILAAFSGAASYVYVIQTTDQTSIVERVDGVSLLGVLVLIAAVALLFTGRYLRSIFDFVMGINRWGFRVLAYAALMRDEYPPFRLDQGSGEPLPSGRPLIPGDRPGDESSEANIHPVS